MILRNRRSGRKAFNKSIDPSDIIFKYLLYGFQVALVILAFSILQSCSSAKKQRMEERDRVSAATGFYCQFINGDQYSDFEVVINLEMAKRCDASKPFSISDYKSAADIHGLLYCCSMKQKNSNANEISQRSEKPRRAKVAAPVDSDDLDEVPMPAPPSAPARSNNVERAAAAPAVPSAAAQAAVQSNAAQSSAPSAPAAAAPSAQNSAAPRAVARPAPPPAEAARTAPVMEPPPKGSIPPGSESGE